LAWWLIAFMLWQLGDPNSTKCTDQLEGMEKGPPVYMGKAGVVRL